MPQAFQRTAIVATIGRHLDVRSDVVGLHRPRRRNVVVVAAMLVVGPDEERLRPTGPLHGRVHDAGDEVLAHVDVSVLLGAHGVQERRIHV